MGTEIKEKIFQSILKTLANNRVMVKVKDDGIYIRMAGRQNKGECFTLEWGKVYSFLQPSVGGEEEAVDILADEYATKITGKNNNFVVWHNARQSYIAGYNAAILKFKGE